MLFYFSVPHAAAWLILGSPLEKDPVGCVEMIVLFLVLSHSLVIEGIKYWRLTVYHRI